MNEGILRRSSRELKNEKQKQFGALDSLLRMQIGLADEYE